MSYYRQGRGQTAEGGGRCLEVGRGTVVTVGARAKMGSDYYDR